MHQYTPKYTIKYTNVLKCTMPPYNTVQNCFVPSYQITFQDTHRRTLIQS